MIDGQATPERSAGDILSRSLRLQLGGQEYVLAVLFIAGNERWRAKERELTTAFVESLEATKDTREILTEFAHQTDLQFDLLYAYDTDCGHRAGVLPPREELKERLYEDDLDRAIKQILRAANPKAVAGEATLRTLGPRTSSPSQPSSTSPKRTAGRQRRSARH